jgi:hypothetical protein
MKDHEDEKEKTCQKNHKLLKALEALIVPVSAYIYFFILGIFILMNTLLKQCSNTSVM